jgi:dsRNA-specific ribonuclease
MRPDPRLKHGDQIPAFKIVPPLEKEEERMIINLYEQVGLIVVKFSQPHKATQTLGIADLQILDPKREAFWWHEVKRRQGPEYKKVKSEQTADQRAFQLDVESTGQRYILGPLSTARDELIERGIIR